MTLTKVKGSVLPDIFPGLVCMFAGTESQIADGWQLCNGEGTTSNGISVPDLRDRMVICAGEDYEAGDSGGSETATTSSDGDHSHSVTVNSDGSHSHTITVNSHTLTESQIASHRHRLKSDDATSSDAAGFGSSASSRAVGGQSYGSTPGLDWYDNNYHGDQLVENTGGSGSHTHTASSNSTGSHSHSASSASTGSHSHTVSTLSPYYALAFIIKL